MWRQAGVARGYATPNLFVQCTLVDMFAKCGCLGEARSVFESMQERDVAAWTAMIGGTVHARDWLDAMSLFDRM
uniref:Pentatricopeptide repeat-containing protein n=1 Tax=Aegilops tauschii subsp. strangulata TaxID=200361 RepID=A0A453AXK3_AEGTS